MSALGMMHSKGYVEGAKATFYGLQHVLTPQQRSAVEKWLFHELPKWEEAKTGKPPPFPVVKVDTP